MIETKTVSVKLDPKLYAALKTRAELDESNVSDEIRSLLRSALAAEGLDLYGNEVAGFIRGVVDARTDVDLYRLFGHAFKRNLFSPRMQGNRREDEPWQTSRRNTPASSGVGGRLHHLDGQAHHRVLRRARAGFQDGEQVGAGPQARAFRRARPQGRGPRAARGQEAHTRARDGERLLEKSRGLLRQRAGVAARYRLMLAEKAEYPITLMAGILCVSRPGFCSWLSNGCPEDDRSAEREAVGRVWLESDRRFGARPWGASGWSRTAGSARGSRSASCPPSSPD